MVDAGRRVHPNARKRVRPTAIYVSKGLQEYTIVPESTGMWRIVRYMGGYLNKRLSGAFTSFGEAEAVLIKYLKDNDKFGKALYPGCPAQLRINSTGHL
jgi:hypothetical protein